MNDAIIYGVGYFGHNDYRDHLAHHGIVGMEWGKRNGPPYPLAPGDHSAAEKKAGWRQSLSYEGTGDPARKKSRAEQRAIRKAKRLAAKKEKIVQRSIDEGTTDRLMEHENLFTSDEIKTATAKIKARREARQDAERLSSDALIRRYDKNMKPLGKGKAKDVLKNTSDFSTQELEDAAKRVEAVQKLRNLANDQRKKRVMGFLENAAAMTKKVSEIATSVKTMKDAYESLTGKSVSRMSDIVKNANISDLINNRAGISTDQLREGKDRAKIIDELRKMQNDGSAKPATQQQSGGTNESKKPQSPNKSSTSNPGSNNTELLNNSISKVRDEIKKIAKSETDKPIENNASDRFNSSSILNTFKQMAGQPSRQKPNAAASPTDEEKSSYQQWMSGLMSRTSGMRMPGAPSPERIGGRTWEEENEQRKKRLSGMTDAMRSITERDEQRAAKKGMKAVRKSLGEELKAMTEKYLSSEADNTATRVALSRAMSSYDQKRTATERGIKSEAYKEDRKASLANPNSRDNKEMRAARGRLDSELQNFSKKYGGKVGSMDDVMSRARSKPVDESMSAARARAESELQNMSKKYGSSVGSLASLMTRTMVPTPATPAPKGLSTRRAKNWTKTASKALDREINRASKYAESVGRIGVTEGRSRTESSGSPFAPTREAAEYVENMRKRRMLIGDYI